MAWVGLGRKDEGMNFKDFAHLLFPSIGAGSSTHAFTRSLFEAIVTEDGLDILNGYDKESFKAYYNGNTKISSLAKKISPYVEPFGFSEFISSFQDGAIQGLCEAFQKHIPDINLHNAADKLADMFASIIREAAAATRKPAGKSARTDSNAESIEAEVVDDEMPSGAAGEDKKITVIQQQTNVIQNGDHNVNLTNNGTINFHF